MIPVDLELVRRYNVPGPRYTSYPTAVKFEPRSWETLDPQAHGNGLVPGTGISLYLHLPFCETLCWFCGCTVVISKGGDAGPYLGHLESEMDLWRPRLKDCRVAQIHWGGGTPTYLKPEQIARTADALRERFEVAGDVEYSVEVDPRRLSREHVAALVRSGVNRVSIGVQDFNPEVQRAINRIQPYDLTREVVEQFRVAGIASLNVDLIYGLPGQTPSDFERTLDLTLALSPERIVTFSYAHVPWMKAQQKILDQAGLPDAETKLRLLKLTIEKLTDAGYVYIGLDHFAKPDDELATAQRDGRLQRNFQGYSTRGGAPIQAFGMSGISQFPDVYFQNAKRLDDYVAAVKARRLPVERGYVLNADDKIRRTVIMEILCNLGLSFPALSATLGINFRDYFARELVGLSPFVEDALIEISGDGLVVTEQGRLFIRNIAMQFDAYKQSGDRTFSRTV